MYGHFKKNNVIRQYQIVSTDHLENNMQESSSATLL